MLTKEQAQRIAVLMDGLEAALEIAEQIREKIKAVLMSGRTGVKL